jgi:two-component system response regulator
MRPILLAEDNENDAVLFKHQLTSAKILNPLHVLTDGEEVIAYLDGQGNYADRSLYPLPVILFLDLRMPKISGYQILAFLQASALHRALPVVVLSVLSNIKDVGEAYQRGAKSFLIKPLTARDLLETIRAIPSLGLITEQGTIRIEVLSLSEDPVARLPRPPNGKTPLENNLV